ncbi:MAG: hypothetical protein IJN51_01020 [Alistipes sp.]|nr:hypothetical protein [Alistipes sp.]
MNTKEFKQPSLEQVQEAFRNAGSNPEIQTLLRTLYGDAVEVDNRPVTERIKSFEDALDELEVRAANGDNTAKMLYDDWHNVTTDSDDLIAFLKLRIVCAALNEGWEPKHTEDEVRYYPWHWLYTQDELKDMREEEKINRCMLPTGEYQTEYAGFGFALSYDAPSDTDANIGSRLCLRSDELAVYCGKQFIKLWADFKLNHK